MLPDELGQILTACVIISMAMTPLLGDVAEKIGEKLEGTKLDQSITCEVEEAPARKTYLVYDPEVDAYVVKVADVSESVEVPEEAAINIEPKEEEGEGLVTADAFVVCGYGAVGQGVCTVLRKNSKMNDKPNYVAFDTNPKRTYQGASNGDTVQYGDGASKTLLEVSGCLALPRPPHRAALSLGLEERPLNAWSSLLGLAPPPRGYSIVDAHVRPPRCPLLLGDGR